MHYPDGNDYILVRTFAKTPTFLRFTELETYVSPSVVKMLVGNKLDKVIPLSRELSPKKPTPIP
jgi:hypothetical protein